MTTKAPSLSGAYYYGPLTKTNNFHLTRQQKYKNQCMTKRGENKATNLINL